MPAAAPWYLLVLLIAAGVTAAMTMPVRALAIKVGYVDMPSDRKMHDRVTPYGGGAAMFIGVAIALGGAAMTAQPQHGSVWLGTLSALGAADAGH